MTAQRIDITIEQGADFQQPFPPILDASGNPVNILAAAAALQIRTSLYDPTAVVTLTTANGGLTASAGGIWIPFIDEDATTALLPGAYVYDLKMLLSGTTTRTHQGAATISGEVTIIVPPAATSSFSYLLLGVF